MAGGSEKELEIIFGKAVVIQQQAACRKHYFVGAGGVLIRTDGELHPRIFP